MTGMSIKIAQSKRRNVRSFRCSSVQMTPFWKDEMTCPNNVLLERRDVRLVSLSVEGRA